jgi:hypothetical protein
MLLSETPINQSLDSQKSLDGQSLNRHSSEGHSAEGRVGAPEAPFSNQSAFLSQSRFLEAMKTQYRLDQQVKFLNLQAEAESLLQQLQAIKQQRETLIERSGPGDALGDRGAHN